MAMRITTTTAFIYDHFEAVVVLILIIGVVNSPLSCSKRKCKKDKISSVNKHNGGSAKGPAGFAGLSFSPNDLFWRSEI